MERAGGSRLCRMPKSSQARRLIGLVMLPAQLLVIVAGCRTSLDWELTDDAGNPGDFATMLPPADLAISIDFARPPVFDLAIPDDAAPRFDLIAPRDFSTPPDFVIARDLVAVSDFSTLPDLSRRPDLSLPIDLATPPDLTMPPDLTAPPDLSMPHRARLKFATPIATPALGAPVSLVAGDWNRDGLPDVAFGLTVGQFGSFLGNGDGSFRFAALDSTPPQPGAIVAGDWNGDGRLDLAIACGGGIIAIASGVGDGSFNRGQDLSPFDQPVALASGDWNGDGRGDLAITDRGTIGQTPGDVSIVLAGMNGMFGKATVIAAGTNPDAVAAGDWNGDGKLDLVTATLTFNGTVRVLAGDGSGGFSLRAAAATDANPAALATGDWNGDGRLDVAAADSGTDDVSVLLGRGDGTFQTRTDFSAGKLPVGIVSADFDLDGVRDLALVSGVSQQNTISVLLGNGDGTFQPPIAFAGGTGPGAIVTADWNGDGRPDLAVTDTAGNAILTLLNLSQ